jgi:hypothetical protein
MGGGSRITLTVPDSFSAPIETETLDVPGSVNIIDEIDDFSLLIQTDPGQPGYNDVTINGRVIRVTIPQNGWIRPSPDPGHPQENDETITLTYGAPGSGGEATIEPTYDGSPAVFISMSKMDGVGTLTGVVPYPSIQIDGSGTATITPPLAYSEQFTTVVIEYTAADEIDDGTVEFNIPSEWTPPQKDDEDLWGFTRVTTQGTITGGPNAWTIIGSQTIRVPIDLLQQNQTVTVEYGIEDADNDNAITNGEGRAIAGGASPAVFVVKTDMDGEDSLTEIASIPQITVDGSGEGEIAIDGMPVPAPGDLYEVNAGSSYDNPFVITYTVSEQQMVDGTVSVEVPASWSPPQNTNPADYGYTTVEIVSGVGTIGTLDISGQVITIPAVNLEPGAQIEVVYGAGASLVEVQGTAQDPVEFTVKSQVEGTGTAPGDFADVKYDLIDENQPKVRVINAADGSGWCTVSPTSTVAGSAGNTLTFTFESEGTMDGGRFTIEVPVRGADPDWSEPGGPIANTSITSGNAGLNIVGRTIEVNINAMGPHDTIVVVYDNATANSDPGTDEFTVMSAGAAGGTLTDIDVVEDDDTDEDKYGPPQPTVVLTYPLDGSGVATVTPNSVIAESTDNDMIFEFTPNGVPGGVNGPGGAMPNGSEVTIEIPGTWPILPQDTNPALDGFTDANLIAGPGAIGPVVINGQIITVPITNTINGESVIQVRYNNAKAPELSDPNNQSEESEFPVQSKVEDGVPPTSLAAIDGSPLIVTVGHPDGSGWITMPIATVPAPVTAGSTGNQLTFIYNSQTDMAGGQISWKVPPDWTPPQVSNPLAPGYTTVTPANRVDSLVPSDRTLTINIDNLITNQTLTITYNGAEAQGTSGITTFVVKSKVVQELRTLTAGSPTVPIVNAADGSGTCEVSPTSLVENSTGNTLTITYTAIGTMDGGLLTVDIDNNWQTLPQFESASGAGYTVADSTGTISDPTLTDDGTGRIDLINVPIVSLEEGETITVVYGAGGGAGGITAPDGATSPGVFAVASSGDNLATTALVANLNVNLITNQPPTIAHIGVPNWQVDTEDSIDILVEVTDDNDIPDDVDVYLYYRPGGENDFTRKEFGDPTQDTTYETTIQRDSIKNDDDEFTGLSYYIMARDLNGASSSSVKYNVALQNATVTLPGNKLPDEDDKFNMVSIPILPNNVQWDTLLDWPGYSELGYHYTDGEYMNIAGMNYEVGTAAWVSVVNSDTGLVTDPLSVTGALPSVTNYYAIPISSGWNQFGCPSNFRRVWDDTTIKVGLTDDVAEAVDIDTASSIIAPYPYVENVIYWWNRGSYSWASSNESIPNQTVNNDSWYTASDFEGEPPTGSNWPGTLDPWGGYWMFSYIDGFLFIDMSAPFPEPPTSAPSLPSSWSVQLSAESGDSVDMYNFAGVVEDAEEGVDRYDVREVPFSNATVQLSFTHNDWAIRSGQYMQDMIQPADEMIWDVQAKAVGDAPVVIKWDCNAVPEKYRTVLLIDKSTEARIDLQKVASYSYTPSSADVRNFELIISTAVPEKYELVTESELLQNYPNPFNPETWIPFKLSKAADVTVKIYNISGQLVRTLDVGRLESGAYTTKERAAYWDGKNEAGERVASGVYLYSVNAGSFSSARKMVILK